MHPLCKISKMQYTIIIASWYYFCALFLHILSKDTKYLLNGHIGMVLHMQHGYMREQDNFKLTVTLKTSSLGFGFFERYAVCFDGNHNKAKLGTINYLISPVCE